MTTRPRRGPAPKMSHHHSSSLPVVLPSLMTKAPMPMPRWPPPSTRAQEIHKRVMIDLGRNWCVDCIVLANLVRNPARCRNSWPAHYELVTVDVGRFDRISRSRPASASPKDLKGVPPCWSPRRTASWSMDGCFRARRTRGEHDARNRSRIIWRNTRSNRQSAKIGLDQAT